MCVLCVSLSTGPLDGVYVVGSLEEALNIRGFRYHPADIEATIVRSHKNIIGRYSGTSLSGHTHSIDILSLFSSFSQVLCSHLTSFWWW